MAMKRCGSCNKSYRSGRLVFVSTKGELVRKRVCERCANDGMTVLFTEAGQRCPCGEPASVCSKCVEKHEHKAHAAGADRKKLVVALNKIAEAYRRAPDESEQEHIDGRVAGLAQAADFVEAGRW